MATVLRIPPVESGGRALGPLAHQAELYAQFGALYGQFWSRGVVDHASKEAARLRNARITDCGY